MDRLMALVQTYDASQIKSVLKEIVPEYTPAGSAPLA
jgi:hypothetical protein